MIRSNLYILFILVLFTGCKNIHSSLQKDEYLEFIKLKSNELNKQREIGDVYFNVSYVPSELMLINQLEDSANNINIQDVLNEKRKYAYFKVKIGCVNKSQDILRKDVKSEEEYFQRIEYYSFKFQNDLKLIVAQDTFPCILSQFDRTYGLTPTIDIACMFEKKNSIENECSDFNFEFYDNYFNCGIVKFVFDGNEICNLPNLKLSENVK